MLWATFFNCLFLPPRPPGFSTPKDFTGLPHCHPTTHFTLFSYKLNVDLPPSISSAAVTNASLTRKSAFRSGPRLTRTDLLAAILGSASLVKDIFILFSYDILVTLELGFHNLRTVPVSTTALLQPVPVLGSLPNDDSTISSLGWFSTYLTLFDNLRTEPVPTTALLQPVLFSCGALTTFSSKQTQHGFVPDFTAYAILNLCYQYQKSGLPVRGQTK